jgi:hypothetical protein
VVSAALLLVGALAAPLCWAAFPRLSDRGLGLSRMAGLVTVTYLLMMALTKTKDPGEIRRMFAEY